jgi:hypothetical protein
MLSTMDSRRVRDSTSAIRGSTPVVVAQVMAGSPAAQ